MSFAMPEWVDTMERVGMRSEGMLLSQEESELRTYWGWSRHAGTLKRYLLLACTMARLASLSDPLTDTESLISSGQAAVNRYISKFRKKSDMNNFAVV